MGSVATSMIVLVVTCTLYNGTFSRFLSHYNYEKIVANNSFLKTMCRVIRLCQRDASVYNKKITTEDDQCYNRIFPVT